MTFKKDLRQLLKPYYWVNMLLSVSYVTCKRIPLICNVLFPDVDCELGSRETEILFFLIIVVMLRTRKAGSVTMVNYLSSSFVYTKIANLILWFYADIRYGLPYGAIIILTALLLPEPTYIGPELVTYFRGPQSLDEELKKTPNDNVNEYGLPYGAIIILTALLLPEPTYIGPELVTYFRGPQSLDEELKKNKGSTWLVCLYAAWHPACVNFAPVFAELSASYSLDNLKFGKLDVGRYPDAAAKYRVQDGPTSRQLPTLLVFKGGEENARRPQADSSGKLQKFLFSKDNVKAAFDLDGLYQDCKAKQAAAKANKKDE